MALEILEPGWLASLQDLGRPAYGRFGLTTGGSMDAFAHRAANAMVNNPPEAALVESGPARLALLAHCDLLMAACGAGFRLWVQGRSIPLWMAFLVRRGEWLLLEPHGTGTWVSLAVYGGVDVAVVMGSRTTNLAAHLGGLNGRALQKGDRLLCREVPQPLRALAGVSLPPHQRPAYELNPTLPVLPGPQSQCFDAQAWQTFLSGEYLLSPSSDRTGYRLEGPALTASAGADVLSEGMLPGCIQVTGSGQLVVMMADCPPTGGYNKIAVLSPAGLPILAQCVPGLSLVRFVKTSPAEALANLRAQAAVLDKLRKRLE
jgi:biotin-dependent carboxylase-like uncharacterized protein